MCIRDSFTPAADDSITQDTNYPQCNSVSDTVRQYFANITTIIQTDIPHIFDVPVTTVTPHKVFLRGAVVPTISGAQASDPDIADGSALLRTDKFFYARYQSAKVFTIHKTHADAIANTNPIVFTAGAIDCAVFADKRESPMRLSLIHI